MKCLSVRQPWAGLIIHGFKPIENRTWETLYRGPLLIHAGAKQDMSLDEAIESIKAMNGKDVFKPDESAAMKRLIPMSMRGIVGIVDIVGVVRDSKNRWAVPGQFHWVLANPRRVEFVALKGRLGLFNVDVPVKIITEATAA